MKFDGFDWDKGSIDKCQKHGVLINDIENIFFNTPLIAPDINHSQSEQRFRATGITSKKRHLFIVFTIRKNDKLILIRPISARYMHEKEVKANEKEISRVGNR
jgi:uncharacterized DUF497 family protein